MIKTIPQAIDDIAVSLGADPSAEIPTVAQALENVYTALGGDRTDLDTLVVSEVIDLVAPLIQGGGGGGDFTTATVKFICTKGVYTVAGSFVFGMDTIVSSKITVEELSPPVEVVIPLYKGTAIYTLGAFGDVQSNSVVTGGITLFDEGIRITGDGTFSADGVEQG